MRSGFLSKNFGSIANVTASLGKRGIMPDQVTKTTGSVADFVGTAGGASTKDLFLSALK